MKLPTSLAPASRRFLLYASRTTFAAEIAEIVWRLGGSVHALVDNLPDAPEASDLGRVIAPSDLSASELELPVIIALITPGHRVAVEREARARGLQRFPALVDPTAVVARTAALGEGVCINALAMIGARTRLGRFTLVNRTASIGHDVALHDFVTIGPGCVVAGQIVIESGAFVGAGAVLAPKVRVGRNAVVGAGAVVTRDVPEYATVVGNPALVLRVSATGYNGASVDADALTVDAEAAK